MSKRPRRTLLHMTTGVTVGWLFADLLLALGMLFLISSTIGVAPRPTPKSTPTPTPTPRNALILEHNYCQIVLTVTDPGNFQTNQLSADDQLEPQIMRIAFLQQRKVGIAITFGGVKDDGDEGRGQLFAAITYKVLQDLGTKSTIFRITSYFNPLFTYVYNSNQVIIDVYLVAQPFSTQETCDQNHQARRIGNIA
jgi:hypothetical protein